MNLKQLEEKKYELSRFSNTEKVIENAKRYIPGAIIFISTNPNKKYMVYNPVLEKMVHFGEMGYEDYTRHRDELRRRNYLARAMHINGKWIQNKYSANNLSINLLWS